MMDDEERAWSEFRVRALSAKHSGSPPEADIVAEAKALHSAGNRFAIRAMGNVQRAAGSGTLHNPIWDRWEVYFPIYIGTAGQNVPVGHDESGLWKERDDGPQRRLPTPPWPRDEGF